MKEEFILECLKSNNIDNNLLGLGMLITNNKPLDVEFYNSHGIIHLENNVYINIYYLNNKFTEFIYVNTNFLPTSYFYLSTYPEIRKQLVDKINKQLNSNYCA